MKKKIIVMLVALLVVVGGSAYYFLSYAPHQEAVTNFNKAVSLFSVLFFDLTV